MLSAIGSLYYMCAIDIAYLLLQGSSQDYICTKRYEMRGLMYDSFNVLLYEVTDDTPKFCEIKHIG